MGRTNLLNLLLGIGLVSTSISCVINANKLKTLELKVAMAESEVSQYTSKVNRLEESLNNHTKLFDQVMENSLKVRQANQDKYLYLESLIKGV